MRRPWIAAAVAAVAVTAWPTGQAHAQLIPSNQILAYPNTSLGLYSPGLYAPNVYGAGLGYGYNTLPYYGTRYATPYYGGYRNYGVGGVGGYRTGYYGGGYYGGYRGGWRR